MTEPRSLTRKVLAIGLGALVGGAAIVSPTPAAAQEMGGQQPPISDPQPLITVWQGPIPTGGPPPMGEMPAVPARYMEPVGPFTMYMEVIATGPSSTGLFVAPGCVISGVFKRGMKMVWRFELYDMASGRRVIEQDSPQVTIALPDGTVRPARFEPRGEPGTISPDSPWTWVATWNIPEDFPLGPIGYSVNVNMPDGRAATLNPLAWGSPFPMVVD